MKNKKLFAILTLVCFMMTLMPVAAFAAGTVDADTSYIYTVRNNPTVRLNGTADANIVVDLRDAAKDTTTSGAISVWFNEEGKDTPTTALTQLKDVATGTVYTPNALGVVVVATPSDSDAEYVATFQRTGTFYVNAATGSLTTLAMVEEAAKFNTASGNNKVTVKGAVNNDYAFNINGTDAIDGDVLTINAPIAADGLYGTTVNVFVKELVNTTPVTLGDTVKGATVKFETNSSSLVLSKESAVTNALGKVSFDVAGIREGSYEIYVTYGSVDVTIEVKVGATDPANIAVAKAPTAPVSIDEVNAKGDLTDIVRFVVTDINGNTLKAATDLNAGNVLGFTLGDEKYVTIVSQPKDSDLGDDEVRLVADTKDGLYATIKLDQKLEVEGTYEFKVALNNGKAAYATVEVAEFGTPVGIVLEYAAPSVELGGTLAVKDLDFVDAKGVTEDCSNAVDLVASGYAIDVFEPQGYPAGTLKVKFDEKYLGSTITVTAVSERYNLMTTATVKVVAEAAGLMFTSKTAEVDVNNAIQVVLVDAQGNRTALGINNYTQGTQNADPAKVSISYVVLDKPEGAKVSVNTASVDDKFVAAGSFKMNLTCNKIGTVKVQAVAKVESNNVTKYYTGIGEFAVGNGQVGKSVVMSIGSNTMIADGKVATVDAQPMIQNGRTFVPFRALAEAFGATVAYDQATSAVKATLNGVEVVMTVGSPVYTVNGVEKTADVAPFIADSRTFVPVRFAAEAFGITVTPTYNTDGSVADVLFNM